MLLIASMTGVKSLFQIKQIKTKVANTANMLKNVSANCNTFLMKTCIRRH